MNRQALKITLIALCAASWLCNGPAQAQAPSATVKGEIASLFESLAQSGCEFSRNGTWYNAQKATEHLQTKYDYLLKKNLVTTTESFIERAATKSSVSGTPYQVRCNGTPPVSSQSWFTLKLTELRK